MATYPNRGRSQLELRRELFEPLAIPSWTSNTASPCRRGTVPQQRAVTVEAADIQSTVPLMTLQVLTDSPGPLEQLPEQTSRGLCSSSSKRARLTDNDPSAGSPTETLLRLLLPLNATVWSSSRQAGRVIRQPNSPRTSLKRSIGSSDGRCVQRAGT